MNTTQLNALLRFGDGWVELFLGKVEIGQGIRIAVAQIAAEELDLAVARIRVQAADTDRSPNASYTSGSNSIQTAGETFRQAAATARAHLVQRAARRLGVAADDLALDDGTFTAPSGARTTYWALMQDAPFDPDEVDGAPKNPQTYRVVGHPAARPELLARVTGASSFVHDLELPGMLHGRILRPPAAGRVLQKVDTAATERLPGVVAVVRDGSFLGVIARREEQAISAVETLKATTQWQPAPPLPAAEALYQRLQSHPGQSLLIVDGSPVSDPVPPRQAPPDAAHTHSARYCRPYHMHASLGPSAAMAQWTDGRLDVWSHTQGVFPLRDALAAVFGLEATAVRVRHVDGAGCYGHNGADDAALDAALLARAVDGRPVLLKWSRADEHAWEPYGSAAVVEMQASLDEHGTVIDWHHDVWSHTHSGRPRGQQQGYSQLLAARHLQAPLPPPAPRPGGGSHGGIHRNADPLYAFPQRRVVKHFVPDSPLRVSALRGLGAYANIFAIESFMDELAALAEADPVGFRLKHLDDPRARAVVETAAQKSGWDQPLPAGQGRGLGFARYKNAKCYAAVVAELEVDTGSGAIGLRRLFIAADAGCVVNPDGLTSQFEGGAVQAASWTLKEAVHYGPEGVLSRDWQTYPVLGFGETPSVEVTLIDRPDQPSLGSGEAVQGPTAAAIANAVAAACGRRLRQLPLTPDRVKAALQDT